MDLTNRHEDWKDDAPNLAAMDVVNPFAVPDNYFENLKENITARVRIEPILSRNKFEVPDGYFDMLEERIASAIWLDKLREEVPLDGFNVPEGYFNSLSESLETRITIEQAETGSAFIVPEGYFDQLQNKILAKTVGANEVQPEAKVRRLVSGWFKYAAAACITAVVATGVYLNSRHNKSQSIEQQLAEIPEQEIVNYLQAYSSLGDGEVIAEHLEKTNNIPRTEDGFSKQEIEDYLESTL